MLGISKYKPNFHTSAKEFKNEFEQILFGLIGKKIVRFWLMWDVKENEWLADGPVILEIDGKRFEFTVYQIAEFSLTISSFELSDKLDWYGSGNEIPLIWKENGNAELTKNLDKRIIGINILTYTMQTELLTGIEFVLEKESEFDKENFFSIYNGLDQNELEKIEIQHENRIRRIKITGYNNVYN